MSIEPLPYITEGLPGTGGRLKAEPEDFRVTELPAYEPCGEGEHLFLWIEKTDRDTQHVARGLAGALGLEERVVSYAGQKDRRAVTLQWFCVPATCEPRLPELELQGVRVLTARRHTNKLRLGHLRGNLFEILVREPERPEAAEGVLSVLAEQGFPNFFGAQRFGSAGDNAQRGRTLLLAKRPPRVSRFQRRLFLSALQSDLFNRACVERVNRGELGKALAGDVLRKEDSGGVFLCESTEVDQPRVDAFEVSPTGPIFGPKMVAPTGEVAEREAALLLEAGLKESDWERGGKETQGSRRTYRVRPDGLSATPEEGGLRLRFGLPRGSYATCLLREVMKGEEG